MARDEEDLEQPEHRRPRVVDKRVSARAARAPTSEEPEQPAPSRSDAAQPSPPPAMNAAATEAAPPGGGGTAGEPLWTPEQEAQARQIAEQIAQTPSLQWVLEAAANLANVAGIKLDLGQQEDAQLAIDALAALLDGVGSRLEDAERPLRQVLAQLQLAFASGIPPGP